MIRNEADNSRYGDQIDLREPESAPKNTRLWLSLASCILIAGGGGATAGC